MLCFKLFFSSERRRSVLKTMIVSLTMRSVQAVCGFCGYCSTGDLPHAAVTDCPVAKLGECFSGAGSPVTLGEGEWDSRRLTGRTYSSVGKGMIMLLRCWEMWLPLTLSPTKESCYVYFDTVVKPHTIINYFSNITRKWVIKILL